MKCQYHSNGTDMVGINTDEEMDRNQLSVIIISLGVKIILVSKTHDEIHQHVHMYSNSSVQIWKSRTAPQSLILYQKLKKLCNSQHNEPIIDYYLLSSSCYMSNYTSHGHLQLQGLILYFAMLKWMLPREDRRNCN